MLTYGLDLSTSPKKSAVVAIEWSRTGAQVVQLHQPVDTQQIINLIVGSDGWWAVDVPFGWPEPFVEFIRDHHVGPVTRTDPARWEQWRTSEISLRETDRHVHDATGVRPLPAAFQLLGATAAHWAVIEAELASKGVVIDRAGLTPRLIETYPSAVLAGWGIQRSPKPTWPVLKPFLGPLKVDGFESLLEANDDSRDALICALVARARALELTDLPTDQLTDLAQAEGWIHLPTASPNQLFERGSHLSELDRDPSLRSVDQEPATMAGDPDFSDVRTRLLEPDRLFDRTSILSSPSPVPAAAGVYAWYFQAPPEQVPLEGCHQVNGRYLLYVGISPRRPPTNGAKPSSQTLRSRIRYHYTGNAEGSTLRLTLGCLLEKSLSIQLRRVGSGNRLTFAEGETALSQWMTDHAFVVWAEHARPWQPESNLIRELELPLNLDQNRHGGFHAALKAARAISRERARQLPVAKHS